MVTRKAEEVHDEYSYAFRYHCTREQTGHLYHEFLHILTMSAGLYQLAAGASDPQQPHTEDELYYVVQGRAQIQVGEEHMPVPK